MLTICQWITSEAYKIFYNVFLHPLRSFPGPLASRATKLPIVYNMVRGRSHLYHNALHHKYGPIVRTEPDTLVSVIAFLYTDPVLTNNSSVLRRWRGMERYPRFQESRSRSLHQRPGCIHEATQRSAKHPRSKRRATRSTSPYIRPRLQRQSVEGTGTIVHQVYEHARQQFEGSCPRRPSGEDQHGLLLELYHFRHHGRFDLW